MTKLSSEIQADLDRQDRGRSFQSPAVSSSNDNKLVGPSVRSIVESHDSDIIPPISYRYLRYLLTRNRLALSGWCSLGAHVDTISGRDVSRGSPLEAEVDGSGRVQQPTANRSGTCEVDSKVTKRTLSRLVAGGAKASRSQFAKPELRHCVDLNARWTLSLSS